MERLFSQWTDDYQDQEWSLALYLLQDRAEAEDVTQEAFIRLWQHRESLSGDRVRPWLLREGRQDLALALAYIDKANRSASVQVRAAIESGLARPVTDNTLEVLQQPLDRARRYEL